MNNKIKLNPVDGHKSFYGKCYAIENENKISLYSYNTLIMTLDTMTGDVMKTEYHNYSRTTRRHQHAFCAKYGITEK